MVPFRQLPFSSVPEAPRVPHDLHLAESRFIPIAWPGNGGETMVHVRSAGAVHAPPLLLVHGFMTSSYSWRYVLSDLARDHRVYAPDLPGSGKSGKPDTHYGPDHLADAIGAIMDALAIREAPVIGNSLGGYLAMRLALRRPRLMSRLVNLHSPGLATARNWLLRVALGVTPRAATVLRHLVWRNPERWVHENVHYYDESLKSREEHREYAAPLREPDGIRAFHRMLAETLAPQEMRAFERSLRSLAGRFPIPLQLIYAAADPMVPPSIGDRLHRLLPSAELVRLQRGSHFAHVDAPDLFLAAVRPFLARPYSQTA